MSDRTDDRIRELLNQGGPPVRDAVFRLSVLERRERQRFQRRVRTMLAGAAAILVVSAFAVMSGGDTQLTGALAVGAAIATAYVAFRGSVPQILRRFTI